MTIASGIERLAALVLLLVCLSHIAAPAAWHDLFSRIRKSGNLAGLAVAAIHLPLGLLIAAFHEVWTWPGVVVTLTGWALLAKGTIYLVAPGLAQRTLKLPGEGGAAERRYRLAGLAMLPFVALLGSIALR
ncbi:MAG TPA: hypothetical protein VFO42_00515 [Sphingomicrobium sp.]|nr:hypothetical protein [Sphingomicrobium sp.]